MAGYLTVKNPLLEPSPKSRRAGKGLSSASIRNFISKPFLQLTQAGSPARIAPMVISSTKRILPSVSHTDTYDYILMDTKKKSAKARSVPSATASMARSVSHGNADPQIHYNGPYDTLDQLPEEKLQWIKREPVEAEGLRHPLVDCPKSIVLRKPVTRSRTFPFVHEPGKIASPKAMFYLRVVQIIHQNSRKPTAFRSSVQIGKSTCTGQLVSSKKCGRHNTLAELDEMFLFDIDQESTAVLNVFAQTKSTLLAAAASTGFGHRQREETMIGKEEFLVSLQASEKQFRRITLQENPACQVLVIYGTFVSNSVQVLCENKCIHEDFITVYIRGKLMPKWERFWAALYGTVLFLYDFEYRDSKPPLYRIPLDFFVQVSQPSADDERQVDAGPLGLTLQFTEHTLSKHILRRLEDETDTFECRMYVLPDSVEASRQWKEMFAYVASLLDQYRQMNYGDVEDIMAGPFTSSCDSKKMRDEDNEQGELSVGIALEREDDDDDLCSAAMPSKFMW